MMPQISKEQAIDIAISFAKQRNLAEFVVSGAFLVEDQMGLGEDEIELVKDDFDPYWTVLLDFVEEDDEGVGLPTGTSVHVDAVTGRAWAIMSL